MLVFFYLIYYYFHIFIIYLIYFFLIFHSWNLFIYTAFTITRKNYKKYLLMKHFIHNIYKTYNTPVHKKILIIQYAYYMHNSRV